MVGITKTIPVLFYWFIKTIVSVVGITKTITVPFIQIIVSVIGITKTITKSFGYLVRLL